VKTPEKSPSKSNVNLLNSNDSSQRIGEYYEGKITEEDEVMLINNTDDLTNKHKMFMENGILSPDIIKMIRAKNVKVDPTEQMDGAGVVLFKNTMLNSHGSMDFEQYSREQPLYSDWIKKLKNKPKID